jgi:hypothetical protein
LTKLYTTEFDAEVPEFPSRTGLMASSVRKGALALLRDPDDSGGKRFPYGNLSQFLLTDFACEIKLRLTSDASGDCGIVMERYRNQFLLSTDDGCRIVTNNRRAVPAGVLRKGDWNSLLYVVRNRRVSGYLNGTLIGGPEDVDSETVFPTRVWIGFGGSPGAACEIDKFTLWDLAGVSDAALAPAPASPPPPTVAFEPDYDSVDLPPMTADGGVTTMQPGYCSPTDAATIGLELASAVSVGPLGLEFKLEPAISAAGARRWDVVPMQNGVTKAAAARFVLASDGSLGFSWTSTEPAYEHLRNCVVFASPPSTRRPLVLRRFTRLPPLLVDTDKGTSTAAIGEAAGFFRLDGVQLELLGLNGFPGEARPTQAEASGLQKISVTHNPGRLEMTWVLSLVKQKGALSVACTMQTLDGKRVVLLSKQTIANESKGIAQQTAAAEKRLQEIMVNKLLAESQRGSLNSPADVKAFNAAVQVHNEQVLLTQAAIAALAGRREVFEQVTGTINSLMGRAAMRVRVYFTVKGKQFEIGRAE